MLTCPRERWNVEVDITTACPRRCSNCTRLTAHYRKPWFMSVEQFAQACEAAKDFVYNPAPDAWAVRTGNAPRTRTVGMMGGEPLIHPQFVELCAVMRAIIPDRKHRFLCSAMDVDKHKYAEVIQETFGSVNRNTHEGVVVHQPVLVAIEELAPHATPVKEGRMTAEAWMWRHINDCWLQEHWSSSINPKGFYWCEVAGSMAMAMGGPGGLPVEPGCWDHDLEDYREQINYWCPKCSICVPLPPRRDSEEIDDISRGNFSRLFWAGSPRIKNRSYVLFDPTAYCEDAAGTWTPHKYMRTDA